MLAGEIVNTLAKRESGRQFPVSAWADGLGFIRN